jgi:hypothetical protein
MKSKAYRGMAVNRVEASQVGAARTRKGRLEAASAHAWRSGGGATGADRHSPAQFSVSSPSTPVWRVGRHTPHQIRHRRRRIMSSGKIA